MVADTSTRLRLVEIRARGLTLPIGRGLACVVTSPAARTSAATFIATLVIGPRPRGADGVVEIAGRLVSTASLPAPLLARSAPAVVDAAALQREWRAVWNEQRDALATRHSTLRFAKHRAEAALEQAQARTTTGREHIPGTAWDAFTGRDPGAAVGAAPRERVCAEHAAALDAVERELVRLDALRDARLTDLDACDLQLVGAAQLGAYRRAELLAGRLPMIIAGGFDEISPGARRALAELFAAATDVQVIVVTADVAVADAVRGAGGTVVAWPDEIAPGTGQPPPCIAERGTVERCATSFASSPGRAPASPSGRPTIASSSTRTAPMPTSRSSPTG